MLLELGLPGLSVVDLVRKIRAGCPHALMIGMTDELVPAIQTASLQRWH